MQCEIGACRDALRGVHAENVLLVKPSALGDVVQSLPVLAALRQRFPRARLTWLVASAYRDLLEGHPALDDVLVFQRGQYRGREASLGSGADFLQFLRGLRARRFDLTIDLQGLFRSGLMSFATGAPVRIGLATARELAGWLYTHTVPVPSREASAVDIYWLAAEALGVDTPEKDFTIPYTDEHLARATEQLAPLPRPWLVVNPGTRWLTKTWPADRFAAVAQRFADEAGGGIVLVGSPDERPRTEVVETAVTAPVHNLAGQTTLKQLAAVLAAADLVLTGDSGPMHMAAAVGTPTVAIFTCTSPARAGPYGPGHTVVATRLPCRGSYRKTCDRLECMSEITVDRVWQAVRHALPGATTAGVTGVRMDP